MAEHSSPRHTNPPPRSHRGSEQQNDYSDHYDEEMEDVALYRQDSRGEYAFSPKRVAFQEQARRASSVPHQYPDVQRQTPMSTYCNPQYYTPQQPSRKRARSPSITAQHPTKRRYNLPHQREYLVSRDQLFAADYEKGNRPCSAERRKVSQMRDDERESPISPSRTGPSGSRSTDFFSPMSVRLHSSIPLGFPTQPSPLQRVSRSQFDEDVAESRQRPRSPNRNGIFQEPPNYPSQGNRGQANTDHDRKIYDEGYEDQGGSFVDEDDGYQPQHTRFSRAQSQAPEPRQRSINHHESSHQQYPVHRPQPPAQQPRLGSPFGSSPMYRTVNQPSQAPRPRISAFQNGRSPQDQYGYSKSPEDSRYQRDTSGSVKPTPNTEYRRARSLGPRSMGVDNLHIRDPVVQRSQPQRQKPLPVIQVDDDDDDDDDESLRQENRHEQEHRAQQSQGSRKGMQAKPSNTTCTTSTPLTPKAPPTRGQRAAEAIDLCTPEGVPSPVKRSIPMKDRLPPPTPKSAVQGGARARAHSVARKIKSNQSMPNPQALRTPEISKEPSKSKSTNIPAAPQTSALNPEEVRQIEVAKVILTKEQEAEDERLSRELFDEPATPFIDKQKKLGAERLEAHRLREAKLAEKLEKEEAKRAAALAKQREEEEKAEKVRAEREKIEAKKKIIREKERKKEEAEEEKRIEEKRKGAVAKIEAQRAKDAEAEKEKLAAIEKAKAIQIEDDRLASLKANLDKAQKQAASLKPARREVSPSKLTLAPTKDTAEASNLDYDDNEEEEESLFVPQIEPTKLASAAALFAKANTASEKLKALKAERQEKHKQSVQHKFSHDAVMANANKRFEPTAQAQHQRPAPAPLRAPAPTPALANIPANSVIKVVQENNEIDPDTPRKLKRPGTRAPRKKFAPETSQVDNNGVNESLSEPVIAREPVHSIEAGPAEDSSSALLPQSAAAPESQGDTENSDFDLEDALDDAFRQDLAPKPKIFFPKPALFQNDAFTAANNLSIDDTPAVSAPASQSSQEEIATAKKTPTKKKAPVKKTTAGENASGRKVFDKKIPDYVRPPESLLPSPFRKSFSIPPPISMLPKPVSKPSKLQESRLISDLERERLERTNKNSKGGSKMRTEEAKERRRQKDAKKAREKQRNKFIKEAGDIGEELCPDELEAKLNAWQQKREAMIQKRNENAAAKANSSLDDSPFGGSGEPDPSIAFLPHRAYSFPLPPSSPRIGNAQESEDEENLPIDSLARKAKERDMKEALKERKETLGKIIGGAKVVRSLMDLERQAPRVNLNAFGPMDESEESEEDPDPEPEMPVPPYQPDNQGAADEDAMDIDEVELDSDEIDQHDETEEEEGGANLDTSFSSNNTLSNEPSSQTKPTLLTPFKKKPGPRHMSPITRAALTASNNRTPNQKPGTVIFLYEVNQIRTISSVEQEREVFPHVLKPKDANQLIQDRIEKLRNSPYKDYSESYDQNGLLNVKIVLIRRESPMGENSVRMWVEKRPKILNEKDDPLFDLSRMEARLPSRTYIVLRYTSNLEVQGDEVTGSTHTRVVDSHTELINCFSSREMANRAACEDFLEFLKLPKEGVRLEWFDQYNGLQQDLRAGVEKADAEGLCFGAALEKGGEEEGGNPKDRSLAWAKYDWMKVEVVEMELLGPKN